MLPQKQVQRNQMVTAGFFMFISQNNKINNIMKKGYKRECNTITQEN